MRDFLSGGVFVAAFLVGIFFLRFWSETQERFFLFFTLAFWLMAFERIPLILMDPAAEGMWYVYLIRLAAFAIIVGAIIDKNRSSGRGKSLG